MYQPIPKKVKTRKGIRWRATFRATNNLSKYKKWISQELDELVTPDIVEYFKTRADHSINKKGILGYDIDIKLSIPKDKFGFKNGRLKRRDVTNAIKATEDGFLEHMGLEDSYTGQCNIRKYFNDEDTWQIEFSMKPIPLWVERKIMDVEDIRQDNPGGIIRTSGSGFSNWRETSTNNN